MSTIRFDHRVALVTGAGRGLGRAHALALARRGAQVAINELRAADGESVMAELQALGARPLLVSGDVADARIAAEMVQGVVAHFGRLDILVNNAGQVRDRAFHNLAVADFEAVIRVHLLGSAWMTQAAWPRMRAQNYGRVLLTTSSSAIWGNFGQSNYVAAKAGLIGLMHTLKLEGQRHGIRVNTLAPLAATPMSEGIFPPELMPRLAPEKVAEPACWLLSEGCEVSGALFEMGGGQMRVVRNLATDWIGGIEQPETFAEAAQIQLVQPPLSAAASVGEAFAAFTQQLQRGDPGRAGR